jgi:hypothetical protein
MAGPLSSTIVALLVTSALALSVLLFALRATLQRPSRPVAIGLVVAAAAGGPFLLRDLARGITLPPTGAGFPLWVAWQLALALVGGAIGLALGLSVAGVATLATLAASASYIAAPTAMRIAVPQANPSLSIGLALGVTFPFNVVVGIPLYIELARRATG